MNARHDPKALIQGSVGSKRKPAGIIILRAIISTTLVSMLALAGVGCERATPTSIDEPQIINTPSSAIRFVSLPGTALPDEQLEAELGLAEALEILASAEASISQEGYVPLTVATQSAPLYTPTIVTSIAPPQQAGPVEAIGDFIGSLLPSQDSENAHDCVTASTAPGQTTVSPLTITIADPYYTDSTSNGEAYTNSSETPFASTAESPLSTFSVDVDTASYANLRRMIEMGYTCQSIPPEAIRIEEMLNYFNYDFIMPQPGEPFAVNAQVADCPWNPNSRLMILGVQAQSVVESVSQGSNLVFLIDVSGSMVPEERLPLIKKSFRYLVEQLGDDDIISIVTYASGVNTVLAGVRGSEKETIINAIDALQGGGSTNGEGGLRSAYALASEYFIEGGNNRIIMATDGDLNVGMNSVEDLNLYVSAMRTTGVYLTTIGVGYGNYKDNILETLADNGNGNYHYLDQLSEAEKIFGEDLLANLVTIADDVKIQIEFNPEYIAQYRLIGYDNRRLNDEDFLDDTKDAAEMGVGHQAIVVYEIIMTDESLDTDESLEVMSTEEEDDSESVEDDSESVEDDSESVEDNSESVEDNSESVEENSEDAIEIVDEESSEGVWLSIRLRYKVPGEAISKGIEFTLDESAYTDDPDEDWMFVSSVVECGLVLKHSAYVGSGTLEDALERAQLSLKGNQYRQEFSGLIRMLLGQQVYGYGPDEEWGIE